MLTPNVKGLSATARWSIAWIHSAHIPLTLEGYWESKITIRGQARSSPRCILGFFLGVGLMEFQSWSFWLTSLQGPLIFLMVMPLLLQGWRCPFSRRLNTVFGERRGSVCRWGRWQQTACCERPHWASLPWILAWPVAVNMKPSVTRGRSAIPSLILVTSVKSREGK